MQKTMARSEIGVARSARFIHKTAMIAVALALGVLLIATSAAVALGEERPGSNPSAAPPTFPPSTAKLKALRQFAVMASTRTGESSPTDVRVYLSTRARANKVVNDAEVDSDQPVYVVTMRGTFDISNAPKPPGYHRSRVLWPSLTLIIDAVEDKLTDSTIADPRDLSPLGPSIPLDL